MRQSDGAGTAARESKIDQKSGDYDHIGISDWFPHNFPYEEFESKKTKQNIKLNSIGTSNKRFAQMTFSWQSHSYDGCDNKKDNSGDGATSLSFVSNGREDIDS